MRGPVQARKLSDEERGSVKGILSALEPFRALRTTMPLQYVTAFLLVAAEEGLGTNQ